MSKPKEELISEAVCILLNNNISVEEVMLLFFKTRAQVWNCLANQKCVWREKEAEERK